MQRTELAIDIARLPGAWETRSSADGHWTKDNKQQLFVSSTVLGPPQSLMAARERASFMTLALQLTFERQGGIVGPISSAQLRLTLGTDEAIACVLVEMPKAEGRGLACSFAHPSNPEVVSVELYWYGESSSDAFLWRARPLFAAVRAQTPRWARP